MAERPSRGVVAVAAAALSVWLWVSLPLALGQRTLFFRDVFSTHLPLKAFGAAELRQGRVPAFNPTWGLGQPFRGNPNTLAFYPGNLLYLALPFWTAFNLHYALHWLLAALAMWVLARELGQGRRAALLAALTYAGSGWILTGLSFYNILAVSAWWPLVMAGAARGGRRGVALGGVACGMALLAGEPVTATLGLLPLVVVAMLRHRPVRGLATAVAIGAVGLVVAAPQVVATLRVFPYSVRGTGLVANYYAASSFYDLHPLRLVELVLPFPFGQPGDFGRRGYWATTVVPRVPYVLSLYPGAVAVGLAAAAARRRPAWASLAFAGLVAAWAGGLGGDLAARLSGGLARYPEKFLFWFAVALPPLAGWGLERVLARPRPFARGAVATAAAAVLAAAWLRFGGGRWAAAIVASQLPPGSLPGTVPTQLGIWLLGLCALAVLGLAAAWAAGRRWGAALVGLQLAALLQLYPMVMTDEVDAYRQPPEWARRLGEAPQVVAAVGPLPFGEPWPRQRMADTSFRARVRLAASYLDPAPGVVHGLSYPLAPDLEGMHSPPFGLLLYRLPDLDWEGRARWLRAVGVEAVVRPAGPTAAGLSLLASREQFGARIELLAVEAPAPAAWWPQRLLAAPRPGLAFAAVTGAEDAVAGLVTPAAVAHDPAGEVRLLVAEPDRLVFEASGGGGIAAVRRAFQPLLVARAGGERLPTLPVNLALLGIEVPPGRHRITVAVGAWPEAAAAAVALGALVAALAVGLRGRR